MRLQGTPTAQALGRAGLYRLVALGFAYPAADVAGEFLRILGLHRAAEPVAHDLRMRLAALAEAFDSAGALVAEYTRLFDRTVACSPYESENVGGMRTFTKSRDLADIQGFYKAFGLELGDDAAEMGDHIRVELEFLSTLALKEAYFREEGGGEGLEITREAQKSFLRDHAGRWIPSFCTRLAQEARHPFYAELAAATRDLLLADLALLEVQPLPLVTLAGPDSDGLSADQFICPKA
jgi:DMSO reductase family type II enzyme chaperone